MYIYIILNRREWVRCCGGHYATSFFSSLSDPWHHKAPGQTVNYLRNKIQSLDRVYQQIPFVFQYLSLLRNPIRPYPRSPNFRVHSHHRRYSLQRQHSPDSLVRIPIQSVPWGISVKDTIVSHAIYTGIPWNVACCNAIETNEWVDCRQQNLPSNTQNPQCVTTYLD